MNITGKDLVNFKVFKGLNNKDVEVFSPLIRVEKVKKNERIIEENETGDSLLFLLNGDISITKALTLSTNKSEENDNSEKELIRLKAKDNIVMGEVSLLSEDKKRSATVTALTDCEIGYLSSENFFKVCEENKEIGYIAIKNISKILTKNLIKSNHQVLKLATAFSLIIDQ